jgi:RecG-like helicase
VSQTDEAATNSSEEKIRKIYARDLKIGDAIHTVFKAAGKEKVTSRAGKTFLTLALVDKTGEVDSRIFDAVESAETSFRDDDYLLVKGKVIAFHGKPQLVIDALERLDPGPIDAKEFAYTAPPAPVAEREAGARHETPKPSGGHRAIKQRILELLDDPKVAQGLDALLRHLDQYIDERVAQKTGGAAPREREHAKKPQIEKRPRVDFRARHADEKHEGDSKPAEKSSPRDPSLPKDLTFKPLSMLAGEPPAPAEPSPKPETGN